MIRISSLIGRFVVVGSSMLFAGCAADMEPNDESLGSVTLELGRPVPTPSDPSLVVPEGNKLAFALDAMGVQIYACQADATTGAYAWVFQAPEATLHSGCGELAGTHYAGPTWEANDGSTVKAARVSGFTPDPSAIPELLLKTTTTTGPGRMAKVTFIQRLETVGGIAPSSACDAALAGDIARVDYTATYYFYAAKKSRQ
jgi:hypothetical protein